MFVWNKGVTFLTVRGMSLGRIGGVVLARVLGGLSDERGGLKDWKGENDWRGELSWKMELELVWERASMGIKRSRDGSSISWIIVLEFNASGV